MVASSHSWDKEVGGGPTKLHDAESSLCVPCDQDGLILVLGVIPVMIMKYLTLMPSPPKAERAWGVERREERGEIGEEIE